MLAVRELSLSVATSDSLSAALVKADEAIGVAPRDFEAELISHGLDRQEANRVGQWYWLHGDSTERSTRLLQRKNNSTPRMGVCEQSTLAALAYLAFQIRQSKFATFAATQFPWPDSY